MNLEAATEPAGGPAKAGGPLAGHAGEQLRPLAHWSEPPSGCALGDVSGAWTEPGKCKRAGARRTELLVILGLHSGESTSAGCGPWRFCEDTALPRHFQAEAARRPFPRAGDVCWSGGHSSRSSAGSDSENVPRPGARGPEDTGQKRPGWKDADSEPSAAIPKWLGGLWLVVRPSQHLDDVHRPYGQGCQLLPGLGAPVGRWADAADEPQGPRKLAPWSGCQPRGKQSGEGRKYGLSARLGAEAAECPL